MFWQIVGDVASVVTIFGLPYLVVNYRKRVPRFSFGFSGSSRQEFTQNGLDVGRLRFQGTVRNQSLDPNSIEQIHLVVWKTKSRRGTRTFGYTPVQIVENGIARQLPLSFGPRESKNLTVTFEIPLSGTHEGELFRAVRPLQVSPTSTMLLPQYEYELAFKDVIGNLFDQNGLPRNQKSINLRWTMENTFRTLRDGHPLAFVRQLVRIAVAEVVFLVRRAFRRLGL